LEKLNDLLQKIKNFNGNHFQEMTNRCVITTFSLVLQQHYDLTTHQILNKALGIISSFRATAAITRVAQILKPRVHAHKLSVFTQYVFHRLK